MHEGNKILCHYPAGKIFVFFPTPTAGGKMVFARRRRKNLGFFLRFLGDFSTFTKDLDTPPVGGGPGSGVTVNKLRFQYGFGK